jgi:DnaJ family protein C protein 13
VLRPLLPDAMLHFLAHHSASAFAATFLSDADTPEAKWTPHMRFALADAVDQVKTPRDFLPPRFQTYTL